MRASPQRRDERGAAVVLGIGMVAVLVVVALVCTGTVAIVLAHRRAQVAADLASLAAAGALQRGEDACAAAGGIAARHRAALTDCLVDGPTVLVEASVRLATALGGGDVRARARAGPGVPGQSLQGRGRPARSRSSSRTAPALSSGLF